MNAELEYALLEHPSPAPGANRWRPITRELHGPDLHLRGNVVTKGLDVYPLERFVALRLKEQAARTKKRPAGGENAAA